MNPIFTRIQRYWPLIFLLLSLVLVGLSSFGRGVIVRNLAWLSLQRAVLGQSGLMEVHLQRAGERFAHAARVYPGDSLTLDGLGLVYLHYGDDQAAAGLFARVPANSFWSDVARLHLLIAQTSELGLKGMSVVGSVTRSWCEPAGLERQILAFTEQKHCNLAYEWYSWIESRCELSPSTLAPIAVVLGKCYVENGDWVAGIALLENAIKLAPHDLRAWIALGDAWLIGQDVPRALMAFQIAREIDPKSEIVRSRLQKLQ